MKRKMISMPSVNRIFRRRSGILNAFSTAWSMGSGLRGRSRRSEGFLAARSADLADARFLQFAIERQLAAARPGADPAVGPHERRHGPAGGLNLLRRAR